MKNLFTLILSFCALTVFGQSIEIQPNTTMVYEFESHEFTGESVEILNISDETFGLEYEVLSNTFLEEWGCTLCAGENCDPFIPETGDLGTLEPDEITFFSFGMSFNGQAGEGTIEIRVFNPNNGDISEIFTLTYIITEATTSIHSISNDYNFKVGPNPVQESILIQSELLQDYEVTMYNNTGQLVLVQNVSGYANEINIGNSSTGIYTLVVRNEGEIVYVERMLKKVN